MTIRSPEAGSDAYIHGARTPTPGKAQHMKHYVIQPMSPQLTPLLSDVLAVLGHRSTDRVSVCTKTPVTEAFRSRLSKVRDLGSWTAPDDRDTWWGVNPIAGSVHRGRGTEADVTRVRAVWADLDVKTGSLASLADCYAVTDLLAEWVGSLPSVLIESGHGLQPIWRIRSTPMQANRIAEHWPESAGEMWPLERWRAVAARWGGLVAAASGAVHPGARVDSVHDLARVLRCPGSVNHKHLDSPVAVRTTLNAAAPGVTRRALVKALDAHSIVVAPTTPTMRSVPTAPREAAEWINAQPDTDVDWGGMNPAMRRLVLYPQLIELFSRGTENESSAHSLMNRRVLAVVLTATEGSAGLTLGLEMIRAAYVEVMDRRRRGEFPGEARSEAVATSDFYRAVVGAVAKARARDTPRPQRTSGGRLHLNITRVSAR